jgi:hypothetical protein
MAGAITISTLNNDTGVLQTQNGMTGIAKAWVKGSVSGTTPTINSSFNVSSVTRNSTGVYTFAFTTAMPSANYSIVANGSNDTDNIYPASPYLNPVNYPSTTAQYTVTWFTGGIGVRDPASINTAVFSS